MGILSTSIILCTLDLKGSKLYLLFYKTIFSGAVGLQNHPRRNSNIHYFISVLQFYVNKPLVTNLKIKGGKNDHQVATHVNTATY